MSNPSEEFPAPLVHVLDHGLDMELQQLEVSMRALLPLVSAAVELRNLSFSAAKADIVLMIVPTIVPMPHLPGKRGSPNPLDDILFLYLSSTLVPFTLPPSTKEKSKAARDH